MPAIITIKESELALKIKTKFRSFRVPIPLDNQIQALTIKNKTTYTDTLISFLVRSLKNYSDKKGVFYCQKCRTENPVKRMHVIPVGLEEFTFCDDCFFSDGYKEFIRQIL